MYSALHAAKSAVKDWFLPQTMFSDLGLKYLGPIDGHDIEAMQVALARARDFRGPVLVHCVTRKGEGYPPAESDAAEQMHSPPAFDPITGKPRASSTNTWTQVFGREMVVAGAQRSGCRRHHRRHVRPNRSHPVRDRVPGPVLRRRHRRATCDDVGGRPGNGRHAPGGRGLRHLPQPGVRPVADGLRAAPARGHRGTGPGRRDRRGRAQSPRHVGHVAGRDGAGAAARRAAGRRHSGRGTGRGAADLGWADSAAVPQGRGPRRRCPPSAVFA